MSNLLKTEIDKKDYSTQNLRNCIIHNIPAKNIFPNPNQPRKDFDERSLYGLAQSIKDYGMIQPLSVRMISSPASLASNENSQPAYELIAGERRLRASQLAGLERIPCLLTEVSDERSAVLALVENLQRQDLGFFEEAQGIARLMETCGLTQEQMARSLGLAPSTLSNKLRLLKLSGEVRAQISSAGLTERHARALLRLDDEESRQKILETVIASHLKVQETDRLIDEVLAPAVTVEKTKAKAKQDKRPTISLVRDVRLFVNTIHHAVDAMRRSGIAAVSERTENEDCLIYTVRIPKGDAARGAVHSATAAQRRAG